MPDAEAAGRPALGAARGDGSAGPDPRPAAAPAESVDDLLAEARASLGDRPGPAELPGLVADGAVVVDIRPVAQRTRDGELPGALVIERNVLEWRLDPASVHRVNGGPAPGQAVVVVCDEGYASSLAAAVLRRLGLDATDLAGGYQAWLAAGGAATGGTLTAG
jgi:rhodanese-related sulfurtransferase